jgi:hypothetical protein
MYTSGENFTEPWAQKIKWKTLASAWYTLFSHLAAYSIALESANKPLNSDMCNIANWELR